MFAADALLSGLLTVSTRLTALVLVSAATAGCHDGASTSEGCDVTLTDSQLDENAASYGGAIIIRDATLVVTDSIVNENGSSASGAGVYLYQSTMTMTDSLIESNLAEGTAGGVAVDDSDFTCTGSTSTASQGFTYSSAAV